MPNEQELMVSDRKGIILEDAIEESQSIYKPLIGGKNGNKRVYCHCKRWL